MGRDSLVLVTLTVALTVALTTALTIASLAQMPSLGEKKFRS